jgi:hypothetical protein
MEFYAIYHTPFAPEELTILHPYAATYDTVTLFITGAANPSGIVDLKIPFNHPYLEGGAGITAEQLDAIVDRLLAPEPLPTADEVQISIPMANYLYETRFKPKPDTGIE